LIKFRSFNGWKSQNKKNILKNDKKAQAWILLNIQSNNLLRIYNKMNDILIIYYFHSLSMQPHNTDSINLESQ